MLIWCFRSIRTFDRWWYILCCKWIIHWIILRLNTYVKVWNNCLKYQTVLSVKVWSYQIFPALKRNFQSQRSLHKSDGRMQRLGIWVKVKNILWAFKWSQLVLSMLECRDSVTQSNFNKIVKSIYRTWIPRSRSQVEVKSSGPGGQLTVGNNNIVTLPSWS